MVLARDIPSLETHQDNMPFPDEDDNTAAFPTYLPVSALVARNMSISASTANVNDEQKPRFVGYAFLDPRHKSTMGVRNMALGGGKWVDTAYLRFDVPDDAGDGDSSSDNDSGYGGGDGDGEGSEAGSVESEGNVGSEGSAASYGSYGSESSQGSQTSLSSAGSDHNSDDDENGDEESEDVENDWDDDDDPYGEVEDDDFEFD